MAKYDVAFACGHQTVAELFGPHAGREATLARMRAGLCADCYKAGQADLGAAFAAERALPELTGSPKQVAWALSLRRRLILDAEAELAAEAERIERTLGYGDDPDRRRDYARGMAELDACGAALERLSRKTEAGWWIDQRDSGLNRAIAAAVKAARPAAA